ncbi:MAG: hypothetical protein R6U96_08980 [Promethearchaeia archaeon]
MNSETDIAPRCSEEIKKIFNNKGKMVVLSVITVTIIYWVVAKWSINKSGYSKDLVVF